MINALDKLDIRPDEIHLWFAFPPEIRDEALLARYHGFLNPEEAHQQQRFHFERHRHQYLITRAVIRSLLSRYHPSVAPAEWCFEKNQYGRPHLDPKHHSPLRFNISHTEGLIACALVLDREIGVDVENLSRGGDLVDIADRFFSPAEVADLHRVPAEGQSDRFFDYWTLKESYIKARGMGLSIPLEQFSFHIDDGTGLKLSVDPRQNDPAERWQFQHWRMPPHFKVALAVERRSGTRFRVSMKKLVPLASQEDMHCPYLRGNFN